MVWWVIGTFGEGADSEGGALCCSKVNLLVGPGGGCGFPRPAPPGPGPWTLLPCGVDPPLTLLRELCIVLDGGGDLS
jgi:hypothetical protein